MPIRTDAPTGLHTIIFSGGDRGTVSTAETWHRYRALYGEVYAWDEPTPAEVAKYEAERARIAALGR